MKRIAGLLFAATIFSIAPSLASAQVSCPAGSRPATPSDLQRAAQIGVSVPNSTCIDDITAKSLASGADADFAYLATKVCPDKKPGIPAGFNANDTSPGNWNQIRSDNGYVYFSAGDAGMNPGAVKCFKELIEAAEAQGMKPCISSGFRTPAHQRASCLAPANTTVCGRANSGTSPDINSCPSDLSGYNGCGHVNGYALDFNENTGKMPQLMQLARARGFSKVGAGANDPWHFEARNCVNSNYKPTTVPQTDTWKPIAQAITKPFNGSTIPSVISAALNPFASAFNPAQQNQYCTASVNPLVIVPCATMQQYPATMPTMPGIAPTAMPVQTSIPTTPGALPAFTSTQTTGISAPASINTSLPTAIPSIISIAPTSTLSGSLATSSRTGTSTLSAFDSILLFASGSTGQSSSATSAPTATSVPVVLNGDLGNIATDGNVQPGPTSEVTMRPLGNATGSVPAGQVVVSETFGSPVQSATTSISSFSGSTFTTDILSKVRNALSSLRDFLLHRGVVPVPGTPQLWVYGSQISNEGF